MSPMSLPQRKYFVNILLLFYSLFFFMNVYIIEIVIWIKFYSLFFLYTL